MECGAYRCTHFDRRFVVTGFLPAARLDGAYRLPCPCSQKGGAALLGKVAKNAPVAGRGRCGAACDDDGFGAISLGTGGRCGTRRPDGEAAAYSARIGYL